MSNSTPKISNLGKLGEARLDLVPPLDGANPGVRPVEYNCLVAPVPSTEAAGKIGSIFIPDEAKENLDLAMQVGRLVRVSPHAFDYARWPDERLKPKPGDIVWFARFAGKEFEGIDGKTYRILKDKDIGAVIEEERQRPALADLEQVLTVVGKPFELDSFPLKETANG